MACFQKLTAFKNGHEKAPGSKPEATVCGTMMTSINTDEVKKFNGVDWWEADGAMRLLLPFNRIRVPFIRDGLLQGKTEEKRQSPNALSGFKILDIGCGGGILSEGLGKLGATVVGIDPGKENISMAQNHLANELKENVSYECTVIEEYAVNHSDSQFDAIVMSEVVEHVENPEQFITTALTLLKPSGSLFITTPNRTVESWFGMILMAEHILRLLPVGTHEWKKFLTPNQIERILKSNGLKIMKVKGITLNPITHVWSWTPITRVQYAMHAVKEESSS